MTKRPGRAATALAKVIAARTPALDGALCRGRPALFDPAEQGADRAVVEQLHDQARALCARCPALEACTTWVKSQPPQQRPSGVVAGRLIDPTPDPSGLPDELAPARADFLRLAAAVAGNDADAIAQVLADLSCLHPAAWQLTLQAAAQEHIAALHVFADGNAQAVHAHLQSQAFGALDHAEVVADRREGTAG